VPHLRAEAKESSRRFGLIRSVRRGVSAHYAGGYSGDSNTPEENQNKKAKIKNKEEDFFLFVK